MGSLVGVKAEDLPNSPNNNNSESIGDNLEPCHVCGVLAAIALVQYSHPLLLKSKTKVGEGIDFFG
ncbi:hypothetical protein H6G68_25070 [Anabaena catenula FACHB-362]|uniref:Uncharacterized protein n=1 Tax=Anabaena catenula FACHB-362 TaxID=2692877 RepID=A0ABR8JBU6_9NOST|nr:hypothetical protein [Anabaena catenula FACHB-362]